MTLRFDGAVVAVSGAGHGLGRAIAQAFAGAGARVFGCYPAPAAMEGVEMAVVDLGDRAAGAAWIAAAEAAAGPLHVLVNNAGGVAGQVFQPIEDVSDAEWDEVLAVNLGAAFALSRAAAPGMKRAGRGRIVNISSGAGLQASLTGIQAYASAKAGLIGLTRQLAHELGPWNVTVNSVAPGFIRSNPTTERQWEAMGPDGQARLIQSIALQRLGTPDDYALRYLPQILTRFAAAYPAVDVEVVCLPSSDLVPRLDAGDLDLTLLTAPDGEADWHWARWLPHLRSDDGDPELAQVGVDDETTARRIAELGAELERRLAQAGSSSFATSARTFDPVLVVLDGSRRLRLLP